MLAGSDPPKFVFPDSLQNDSSPLPNHNTDSVPTHVRISIHPVECLHQVLVSEPA